MDSDLRSTVPASDPSDVDICEPVDNYEPPATDTERVVADIWGEILSLPRVSVAENFFDLGGHSVLVHMVREQLVQRLGTNTPLVDLFQYPTVRSLARHLDGDPAAERGSRADGVARRTGGLARLDRLRAQRIRPGTPASSLDPPR